VVDEPPAAKAQADADRAAIRSASCLLQRCAAHPAAQVPVRESRGEPAAAEKVAEEEGEPLDPQRRVAVMEALKDGQHLDRRRVDRVARVVSKEMWNLEQRVEREEGEPTQQYLKHGPCESIAGTQRWTNGKPRATRVRSIARHPRRVRSSRVTVACVTTSEKRSDLCRHSAASHAHASEMHIHSRYSQQ